MQKRTILFLTQLDINHHLHTRLVYLACLDRSGINYYSMHVWYSKLQSLLRDCTYSCNRYKNKGFRGKKLSSTEDTR